MKRRFLAALSMIAVAVLAQPAAANAATAGSTGTGSFCNTSLSRHTTVCFDSMSKLQAHRSAAADYDLVAMYNWVNYNQGGGYNILSGDHVCTASYSNNDYELYDLSIYSYNNGINMNNTFTSVSTYTSNPSKCDIKLYDGFTLTGASSVFIDRCTDLTKCVATNWSDRASSFVLS
ncbi:hypothetical protein [Amycolatopsis sp. cg9]|uniref:hypothetical protein n=1 Tax=Amycolatopsis sp. cg9 TaxID=3238801 RepID=UPI0035246152